MAVLKIVSMGHPVLRQVADPIPLKDIQSDEIQNLIEDMVETMFDYNGLGLAAPQIDVSLQLVVMLWGFDENPENNRVRVLINPEISPETEEESKFWEGCLSVPGMRGLVSRPNKIHLKAYDQAGKAFEEHISGFAATVVQHECDHLHGKLYVDRISDMRNFAYEQEYQRYLAHPPEKEKK